MTPASIAATSRASIEWYSLFEFYTPRYVLGAVKLAYHFVETHQLLLNIKLAASRFFLQNGTRYQIFISGTN